MFTVLCSLREAGAFTPQVPIGPGKCNVRNEEEVIDPVHADTLTSFLRVTYETGLSGNAI
jgi:hypothetical protein